MAREIKRENPYLSKLLKLIPTEIVAGYLAIVGFVPKVHPHAKEILLVSSIALLIVVPFLLYKVQQVKKWTQIVYTMIAFVVWIYTLGGPFEYYGIHDPVIGSVILVFWTLLIPFAANKTS